MAIVKGSPLPLRSPRRRHHHGGGNCNNFVCVASGGGVIAGFQKKDLLRCSMLPLMIPLVLYCIIGTHQLLGQITRPESFYIESSQDDENGLLWQNGNNNNNTIPNSMLKVYPRIIQMETMMIVSNSSSSSSSIGTGSVVTATSEFNIGKFTNEKDNNNNNTKNFGKEEESGGDCIPMRSWQEDMYPSCNVVHEITGFGHISDLSSSSTENNNETDHEFALIGNGGYNHVFLNSNGPKEKVATKTLIYPKTSYSEKNYDRVRSDVMILERATKSPYIIDVYGYCGFTQLMPYGTDGSMRGHLIDMDYKAPPETKLRLAVTAASAIHDLHNIDNDHVASVTHGDLKFSQFMLMDGKFKLGDFNFGQYLQKNKYTNQECPYNSSSVRSLWRSPEELERSPVTSKIDIWTLGSSIFFRLLTGGHYVWDTYSSKHKEKIKKKILEKNAIPPLPEEYYNTTDPIDNLLRTVIYDMCLIGDPTKRSTSYEIVTYMKEEAAKLGYSDDFFEMEFVRNRTKKEDLFEE